MADTVTPIHGFTKPEVNASDDTWGAKLNTDWDLLDSKLDIRSSTAEVLAGTAANRTVTPSALAALWIRGTDVTAATNTILGDGSIFQINGVTTISGIDFTTPQNGRGAWLLFANTGLTLVHSTNLQLPNNGSNIITTGGDRGYFVQFSGDMVLCISYQRGTGVSTQLPIGSIAPYGAAAAPALWLTCDGANKSRSTYSALFAAISTFFGTGDGSTTFGIPDLRGRVVAGVDGGAGRLTASRVGGSAGTFAAAGGEQEHTPTQPELVLHTHSHQHSPAGGGYFWRQVGTGGGAAMGAGTAASQATTTDADASLPSSATSTPHNNVQPTIVLNYIIYAGA